MSASSLLVFSTFLDTVLCPFVDFGLLYASYCAVTCEQQGPPSEPCYDRVTVLASPLLGDCHHVAGRVPESVRRLRERTSPSGSG